MIRKSKVTTKSKWLMVPNLLCGRYQVVLGEQCMFLHSVRQYVIKLHAFKFLANKNPLLFGRYQKDQHYEIHFSSTNIGY